MINLSKGCKSEWNHKLKDDDLSEKVVEIKAIIPVIRGLWRSVSHTSKTTYVDGVTGKQISQMKNELSSLELSPQQGVVEAFEEEEEEIEKEEFHIEVEGNQYEDIEEAIVQMKKLLKA